MLSKQTIEAVKATAPILEQHGETLTRHFYKRMFSHNPEVIPYFNQAHQAAGRQQKALAAAICAYAANIDRLEALGGAAETIAQKHASLQIKAEHYPIVGQSLLASIREVLGDAATDEIMDAWAEAYGLLAKILIGRESTIYRSHTEAAGGWEGFKSFRVLRKAVESEVITSFYLVPADGTRVPSFKPGQYLTVRVPTPDGRTTMRNYSLSDKPGLNWLRISVKREDACEPGAPQGYVSNVLHASIEEGATLDVAFPCGEFFLDVQKAVSKPLVLLAAGVGITPVFSMLRAALDATPEREIVLIHACLHEGVQAFRKDIDELSDMHENLRVHYRYSSPRGVSSHDRASAGLVDEALMDGMIRDRNAEYYVCGPDAFMRNVYTQLSAWDVPAEQIHYEFFGPQQKL